MKSGLRSLIYLMMTGAGAVGMFSPSQAAAQSTTATASSTQQVRPIGVVTRIQPGSFTLHTDAAADLLIQVPEGATVLRVPPGSKDLKTATKITIGDVSLGDRVLIRGRASGDLKSVVAASVIVMSKTDVASAHEAERLEWQRRGIGGPVKAVNPATREITISVPTVPPTPGNTNHTVIITLGAGAGLLRYAPDSVKFSEAKPSAFEEIKVGDQARALGTKSEDGNRFTAEKLVSGAFRNIGATVVSVDTQNNTVTVKDLSSGNPTLIRTNTDSNMHRLPPFMAQMIAALNSGQTPGTDTGAGMPGGGSSGAASGRPSDGPGASGRTLGAAGGRPRDGGAGGGSDGSGPGSEGGWRTRGSVPGRATGGGSRDFNQMLDRTPVLKLDELKPGDALIVVSTQGAKTSEVTAIVLLAGVEPILAARPRGANDVVLPQWNMSSGGGDAGP